MKKKISKPTFKEENVQLLLTEYNKLKDEPIERFGEILQSLHSNKTVTQEDILEIQNRDVIGMGDFICLCGYVTHNGTMYYSDALSLARKYHMLLLAVIEKENSRQFVNESFRMYEKSVDEIYNSTFNKDLLKLVQTLSNWEDFDKIDAYNKYKSSSFYGKLF